ncbi:acyl-CoA dehydrogenase family protein [Streptomyces qinglanensis]|uniref:acyl-CoA dehydrogenase family protein n=1 Tax=Streptomyces qinglanensis TaxID=943816 RepID=UPI0037A4CBC6
MTPPDAAPPPHRCDGDPLRTRQARHIADVLGAQRPPAPGEGPSRNHRTHHALTRLAAVLPPARELLRDREWLAALSACTALVDPALYMTVVNHHILCLGSVAGAADAEQLGAGDLAQAVEALESGHRKGVFLVTEIGDANSHLALRTTAEFDPERREFVLRTPDAGAAKFSGVGVPGRPQSAVVCARLVVDGTCHGVHPFLADLCDERSTAPGVAVSGPLGVEALPLEYALVRFEGARLPYDRWLRGAASIDDDGVLHDPGGGPDRALQRTLDVGRRLWATVPTAAAATARASAVAALRHSQHRRSHGRIAPGAPVLAYRTQQRAVLGALAEAFALDRVASTALDLWQQAEEAQTQRSGERPAAAGGAGEAAFTPWAAVDRRLSALKASAVDGAARVTAECRRRCGVAGYLAANRLSGYSGFADSFGAAGGDNRLVLLDVGCALAEERPADGPPADTRPPPDPDDPTWWCRTVTVLEQRLAAGLRAALEDGRRRGLEGMDLWNPLLERARQLGEVHTLRLAAQSVAASATTGGSDPARRALTALYGTTQALRLAGPLQWTGVVSARTAASLDAAADRQCARLVPHIEELAAALAPPESLAPTPLTDPDYATALHATLDRPDGGHP